MYKLIFFSYFILSLLDCNSQEGMVNFDYLKAFELSETHNVISINNSNPKSVRFKLTINDVFPLSYPTIIEEIQNLSKQRNYTIEKATWKYVSDNTFFAQPFSSETWQHSPIIFLNSLGGGFCDDRASVLAKMWQIQGFPAKVIGLEGHVVAEVYTENKWKMFDANNDIFYMDQNETILSVKELEKNVNSINFKNYIQRDINPTFLGQNPISEKLNSCYLTDYNNNDQSEWHLNYIDPSVVFELPSNSSLNFIYDDLTGSVFVKVKLNKGASGHLQIPLVPIVANGNFSILSGDSVLKMNGEKLPFAKNTNQGVIQIVEVIQDSEIQYLVNPKIHFLFLDSTNKVNVNSNGELDFAQLSTSQFLPNFDTEMYLFFDVKTKENYLYLSKVDDYLNEPIDFDFLKKQFALFLSCDTISNEDQKKEFMVQFEKDYSLLKKDGKGLEELMKKNIRRACCIFF